MYWDPPSGNSAVNINNWDVGSLGSGTHPAEAPGYTPGETDSIYFDGTAGKGGNQNCTWDYTPVETLFSADFQNSYNQTLTFQDKAGFSVSNYADVDGSSGPTIAPNGTSGANALAAVTLTNGAPFIVSTGGTLFLQGYSTGGAIFAAGDGKAGEYLFNGGTVAYAGVGNNVVSKIDYLNVPVHNARVFKVNGNKGPLNYGSTLQVSGADSTNTSGVSFYQDRSVGETDISGNGTLWCVNDFTMTTGLLQTTDSQTDILQVGTPGPSPVDGTVTLSGGTVNINPGMSVYGTLQISGTTGANQPTLNVGSAQLNFKVDMTAGSTTCDQLILGKTPLGGGNSTGKANFSNNGGSTTVNLLPQGTLTTNHKWQVIFFGPRTGDVTLVPTTGYRKNWSNPNILEIDN